MNEDLLLLTHEIRQIEHNLSIARRRRKLARAALIFGPVLALVLYGILWIPDISRTLINAIYIPAVLIVVVCFYAWYRLTRYPGAPVAQEDGSKVFVKEGELELTLARKRDTRKLLLADADTDITVRRVTYKEDAFSDINQLRNESRGYRSVSNFLQGILIIGSFAATATSSISGQLTVLRWVTPGITFLVGVSSGFMSYFKYKERSFYLQQTADAIESEWEAVEIGVGRYKRMESEEDRLADFVEEVHRLKVEQKKRQQNLEQPPELRNPNE